MTAATELSHLDFELSGNPYCCGVYDLGQFAYRQNNLYGRIGSEAGKKFPKEVVFANFDKRIGEELWDDVRYNGGEDNGYYLLQTTLIADTPEFEALVEHFKDKKWKLVSEFQNHNTKNTVFVFSKKFKFSALKRKFESTDEDDGW